MRRIDDGVTKEASKALIIAGALITLAVCAGLWVFAHYALPTALGLLQANVHIVMENDTEYNWTRLDPFNR